MSITPAAPDQTLLRTPLYDSHRALGAKMVPFAGWEMPVSYPIGTVAEVKACRSSVGLFDVSHMGEVVVTGSDSQTFLSYATTNDIARLSDGTAQYSLLLNHSGTVIDDIIVYRNALENEFLIVVNASRVSEDFARLAELASNFNVQVQNWSSSKALIGVQGPNALDLIRQLCHQTRDYPNYEPDNPFANFIPQNRFSILERELFQGPEVLISRTGYTGEDGVEILCESADANSIWNDLIELGGVPCGLGARDVLRLEAGYPLYGHELDEEHSPFESGVGWVVKLDKGSFAGSDALLKQNAAKPISKLVGLKAVSPMNAIPRQGCVVEVQGESNPIGEVTSGTLSPILGAGIALARVQTKYAKLGTELIIDIRGRKITAEVVKTPFVETSLSGAGG